ncbi:MAG: hypothetical protein OEY49_12250, partial [Candidatus Heimdallarchaeota archaeon]|nr:hypothetical protein [Candidatus Heimdallarchaeota archaeon]
STFKLHELWIFLNELENTTYPREELLKLASIQFDSVVHLMPQSPPSFLLITLDGRLVFSMEAIDNPHFVEESKRDHLIAGVLTAIQSVMREATLSEDGSVKELNSGDSTILIEVRQSFMLIVSCVTVTDELRIFSTDIADKVEGLYGQVLKQWFGDKKSVIELSNYFKNKVIKEVVRSY